VGIKFFAGRAVNVVNQLRVAYREELFSRRITYQRSYLEYQVLPLASVIEVISQGRATIMVAERMHSQVAADGLSSIGVHQTVKNAANISQVEEYCNALGGTHPIHSILIANNGMAAVKFMRSIRSWAYETFGVERAVLLVAMATPEDMRINAEHIRMADQFLVAPTTTIMPMCN
jgi:hypothetical protein